jgi:hypothetical protein|tara:strand:- start:864 stop:1805 length:942 start_codon:yes stop_codon:yes gene_type:complete
MASSYTSRIRLTKQADGENPNTWGTILNNQVIDLLDDAIASYTTISIGSAATVTLTENEGAADQSRSAFIELTGSVGGANNTISLIIPAKSKSYVINNKVSANTTASDIVKMKTAGGDGYDIKLGAVGLVICDGTSVHSLNATGFNLGTAASADIGVCTTNVPDTSLADIRYLRVSTSSNVSLIGSKFIVGASVSTPGNFVIGTNARAYNPIVTVTDAACISVNMALGNNFVVTLAGNRTLKKPANCTVGQGGNIYFIQDGTGSRTLGYNTAWQFVSATVPTLSTGAADVDMLVYNARSSATIDAVLLKNFDR